MFFLAFEFDNLAAGDGNTFFDFSKLFGLESTISIDAAPGDAPLDVSLTKFFVEPASLGLALGSLCFIHVDCDDSFSPAKFQTGRLFSFNSYKMNVWDVN